MIQKSQNTSKKYKVLLVDDDVFISDLYALKFNRAGHTLVVANSADEALELLRKEDDFDAIATDLIMPVKDGFEFLEEARENDLIKDAIIIVLSNQDGPDVRARFKGLGAKAHIVKAHALPNEVLKMVECAIDTYKYGGNNPQCARLDYAVE